MIYATYEYYTTEYCGTAIPEHAFPKYARRASAEIDHVTFGRISALPADQVPGAVRDATCDVAEHFYRYDTDAEGGRIASESNDGYSITYRDAGDDSTRRRELWTTIRTYLAVTGLMFRGVHCCDDLR